ncbi:hypothetical protein [uncultured Amnibacterium sp.]|uniref:hypothetical protein n=1 Tax=uncultured Amnibacterium sp. TaxID=1631851 RepID=UPI0035C9A84D
MTTDLIGNPLSPQEERLIEVYESLKSLVQDEALAPGTRSNLLAALAATGVAVTGLGLKFEHLIDIGA